MEAIEFFKQLREAGVATYKGPIVGTSALVELTLRDPDRKPEPAPRELTKEEIEQQERDAKYGSA